MKLEKFKGPSVEISGFRLDSSKRVDVALSSIKGIGLPRARLIACAALGIERDGDWLSRLPKLSDVGAQAFASMASTIEGLGLEQSARDERAAKEAKARLRTHALKARERLLGKT